MSTGWTARDLDIVETLTRRVRLLTIEQITRIWWPSTQYPRIARRRLRRLTLGRLLQRTFVNVHPLLPVKQPLISWNRDEIEPNFHQAMIGARTRWAKPACPAEVYWATPVAANLFGSTATRFPPMNHRDHDLLLGQVYVLYRTKRPADASKWIGEDAIGKAGHRIKDPDAFLVDETGAKIRVVESAGRYSVKQIEAFHCHCAKHELPYELW